MKWFHDKDGGLMAENIISLPLYGNDKKPREIKVTFGHTCTICGYSNRTPEWNQDCVRFSDLSEDLQAAALGEML